MKSESSKIWLLFSPYKHKSTLRDLRYLSAVKPQFEELSKFLHFEGSH